MSEVEVAATDAPALWLPPAALARLAAAGRTSPRRPGTGESSACPGPRDVPPPPRHRMHSVRLSQRAQAALLTSVAVLAGLTVVLALLAVSEPMQALAEIWSA